MPCTTRILRLQRTDEPKEHILLRVDQQSATKPLDLKLVATEHEHLYHGAIKSGNVLSLKASRYSGDEDELRDILYFCFLQDQPDGASDSSMQGLEMVASLEKQSVVLTIRRITGEITTRIATVQLSEDDEREEVSPFEWVDTAVSISDEIRNQTSKLEQSIATQRDENTKLKKQLDDFIKLKKENEAELLQKFAALLNTKKRKIRDLQSQLGGSTAEQTGNTKNKRKAQQQQQSEDDVEMEEASAVDQAEENDEMLTTPPATDDEGNEIETLHAQGSGSHDIVDLPPSRQLPFAQKRHATRQATQDNGTTLDGTTDNNDEDDTDDEL